MTSYFTKYTLCSVKEMTNMRYGLDLKSVVRVGSQLTKTNLFQFNCYKDMCNLCIFTFDCIVRMSDLLKINQAAPCRLPRSCCYFGGHSHSFYFGHPFILIIIRIMTEGRLTRRLISFLVGRSMLMLDVGGHYNASNCDF